MVLYSVKWYKYIIGQLLQRFEVQFIVTIFYEYIPNKGHDNTDTNTNLIQPRP